MNNEFISRIPDIIPIPVKYSKCKDCFSLNPSNNLCLKKDSELFRSIHFDGKNWSNPDWVKFNELEKTAFIGNTGFTPPNNCPYILEYTIDS